jgi:penicillin amidase/acyl-homoserine-lactone acylase
MPVFQRIATVVAAASLLLVAVDVWLGRDADAGHDAAAFLAAARAYDAEIVRDEYGVPHVYGRRNADVAFGLAVAHAEDDIETIESNLPLYRGEAARFEGPDAAPMDFLIQWLGLRELAAAHWRERLSPEVRAVLAGYVAGLNYHAAVDPGRVDERLYPVTEVDIVTAFAVQHLLFYGFQRTIGELFAETRQRAIADAPRALADRLLAGDVPIGSNAMAVAPSRSKDGATRLLGNSHQPLSGPLAWYEVHLRSEAGWRIHGGLFPGSPVVSLGATPTLGWGVTVNQPDLVDVYVLETDASGERYRLDGEWRDFETREATIPVRLLGNFVWTTTRPLKRSVHGPVLETPHGTYALRFAGMDEIRQVDQWFAMNTAADWDEWRAAMAMDAIASFNFVYADASGRIAFVHNARTPARAPGWDWRAYLPGDRSDLIWTDTEAFADNPSVVDPASGYLLSANQTPFRVTDPADDADPDAWPPEAGLPTRMTNRAVRGLALLAADDAIDRREFEAIKFDDAYARDSRAGRFVRDALALEFPEDSRHERARRALAEWDFTADADSMHAALAICLIGVEWQAEQRREARPDVRTTFTDCADEMLATHGGHAVRWGDVNRLVRGEVDLAVDGGPDTLRAIYSVDPDGDDRRVAVGGDGLMVFAEWDADGTPLLRTVHQYGASNRTTSPHYADQAPLFAAEELRTVRWDPAAVRAAATSIERVPARGDER